MAWIIKTPNGEVDSDDFTLGDLLELEKEAEEPWSLANPLRNVATAQAFLRIAYRRSGSAGDVDALTLRVIKKAFDFREDAAVEAEEPDYENGEGWDSQVPLDQKDPASSSGAPAAGGGRRKRAAASA